jgi:hypothetical protein
MSHYFSSPKAVADGFSCTRSCKDCQRQSRRAKVVLTRLLLRLIIQAPEEMTR